MAGEIIVGVDFFSDADAARPIVYLRRIGGGRYAVDFGSDGVTEFFDTYDDAHARATAWVEEVDAKEIDPLTVKVALATKDQQVAKAEADRDAALAERDAAAAARSAAMAERDTAIRERDAVVAAQMVKP